MAKPGRNKPPGPLAPVPVNELRRQAQHLMRNIYRPEFRNLHQQERRLQAIAAKRAHDNKFYLNWLQTKSSELQANARAADQQLMKAQQQIHADTASAYGGLRDKLVTQGATHVETVSDPNKAASFDISEEALAALSDVGAERQRSADMIGSKAQTQRLATASNFAMMAAADANRQADLWKGLSKVSSARTKLKLDRAAATAKEVARLLDREIQKAEIKGKLKQGAQSLALQAQAQSLDAQRLDLDYDKAAETARHNQATEDQAAAELQESRRNHNLLDQARQADSREERRKAQRAITTAIHNGIQLVARDPSNTKGKNATQIMHNVTRLLIRKKYPPLIARTVSELMVTGEVSKQTNRALRQAGYHVPDNWR